MKSKKMVLFTIMTVLISVFGPVSAFATSVDEVKKQEAEVSEQGEQLSQDIQTALNSVNEKYREVEELKEKISEAEEKISQTETEISKTEKSIKKRQKVVDERLKDIQISQGSASTLDVLLSSESFSDFINRAYAMNVIQQAEKSKISELNADKEKLTKLQKTLEETQKNLLVHEDSLQSEATTMNNQIDELKEKLADNQAALSQLASTRQAEESRIAREKEAAKKAEAEKQAEEEKQKQLAESSKASSNSAESSSETSSKTESSESSTATPVPETPAASGAVDSVDNGSSVDSSNTGGKTLTMVSTAYSYEQPGLTYYTATGHDLRTNPNVIAVDSSVIPLGSLVEVSGYGIAIAADTGGDIVGNRIDVHFPTVSQCKNWGRRTVSVTIK